MLKKVVITNCFDESMTYAIDGVQADNPSGLIITSIDGLGPVKASINMLDLATTDGQKYSSARLPGRNIVIKALFTHATSIEEARLLSYKYFPIKKKLKFHIETDTRVAEIEGYVESNEPDIFSEQSSCQISIVCENPYFDGGEIEYRYGKDAIPLFKFEFGNDESQGRNGKEIKMSQYPDLSTDRQLVYTGDADTGVKLDFNFLTDDPVDTFKVTKIEMSQNGEKIMGLDLSKMKRLVPNSAVNAMLEDTYFVYRNKDKKYKYFGAMPEYISNAHPVVYRDNIHLIFRDRHYLYYDRQWKLIDYLLYDMQYSGSCVVYNDEIYALGGGNSGREFLKWNETDHWIDTSSNLRLPYSLDRYGFAVVCNNKIHILGGSNSSTYNRKHYSWDGNAWSEDVQLPIEFDDGFPIVYENTIYLFPQSYIDNYYSLRVGDSTWTEHSHTNRPAASFYSNTPHVIFDNKLHIFGSFENSKSHFVYDFATDTFSSMEDSPEDTYSTCGCAMDDLIYLFGGSDSKIYSEEANNGKLIENDQLIVNTIKGQKSVTLLRGDNKYNVLNILEKNSKWFELKRGINDFSFTAEGDSSEDLKLSIFANKLYEGV